MRVRVKICGLTTREAASAAIAAGADAVGFVFAASPREITVRQAVTLARGLPPRLARVAVFRHPAREQVLGVLESLRHAWIQTDVEDLDALALPPAVRVLPVFRDVPGAEASLERYLAAPGSSRPRVVFESRASGSGLAADPGLAARFAARTRLVLAGGLRPSNVGEAIRRVRPYAVDVSSGVESSPGVKDPGRIAAFVRAVRETE